MSAIPHPLSHAYIVTGGDDAGREAFVQRLAAAYVCGAQAPPCGTCRHCRKARAGIHPDVITVEPEDKGEIVAAQARALRSDAYVRPNEAARKVFLIRPAHALNPAAQNILLKVVEEGPPYAAFLLPTPQPGLLLETLRSRCETLRLPPAGEEAGPGLSAQAEELAALLLDGDELALAAFAAARDKLKGEEALDLLALTEQALARSLACRSAQAVPLLERLRELRALRPYHVGGGMLLGALCAGRFSPPPAGGGGHLLYPMGGGPYD